MQVAKVIGNIWATRKESTLTGMKLLIVQPINVLDDDKPCGMGETVIIVTGSTARVATGSAEASVDATVVGIVDDKEFDPGLI